MIRTFIVALLLAFGASAASAAILNFQITGTRTASFTLDTTAQAFNDVDLQLIGFTDVVGTFGPLTIADIYFYTAASTPPGGFVIDDFVGGTGFYIDATGPALFTGSLDTPDFLLGSFAFTEPDSDGTFVVTVTPVPEVDTWLLMIAGFGAIGFIMRSSGQRKMPRRAMPA